MESANADDKEDLVDMTEAVRDALEANDPAAIERTMAELSDLVFYLES